MDRDEFVEYYYNTYGEFPDEAIIDEYCDRGEGYLGTHSGPKQYYPKQNNFSSSGSLESTSDDLLSEVNSIFKGIARSARGSIKAHSSSEEKPTYGTEFAFMALIFLSKAMLYFLVKDSHQKGYDFSNL